MKAIGILLIILGVVGILMGMMMFGDIGVAAITVGAIAGGLAGLYYGYESIQEDWLAVLQRRKDIEEMCKSI